MVRASLAHIGTFPPQKRGRPSKSKPSYDYGTKELKKKRECISLHDIQLSGTVAAFLLQQDILTLLDIEALQKIHLLKRRYRQLLEGGAEVKSQLSNPLSLGYVKNRASYYREQRENQPLEDAWKNLCLYLVEQHCDFLKFVEGLFQLHSYETVRDHTRLFQQSFSSDVIRTMACIAHQAFKTSKT